MILTARNQQPAKNSFSISVSLTFGCLDSRIGWRNA